MGDFRVTFVKLCVYRLIHCTWVYPLDQFEPFFGYYFFNVMLMVLLLLHVFWASLILRMVKKCLFGKVSIHCSSYKITNKVVSAFNAFPTVNE